MTGQGICGLILLPAAQHLRRAAGHIQSADHVALTPEGWPVITRAFFTGRNNFTPDIKEMQLETGDMILICSDGVYCCGKWSKLNAILTHAETSDNPLPEIESLASDMAHDNYSAILIRVCKDQGSPL